MTKLTGCSIKEARDAFACRIKEIKETEEIHITEAAGRVSASAADSGINIPAFDRSAMDGYAVKAEDIKGAAMDSPVTLKVIGEIFAGDCGQMKYTPMTAVRIMTGAMIPEGYDCVVKQEDTDLGMENVQVYKEIAPYTNYGFAGEDVKKGAVILKKGTLIGRGEIYRLASSGLGYVSVVRRPKVTVISTGSELLSPGDIQAPGKIYEGAGTMLSVSVKESGCVSENIIVPDSDEEIKEAVLSALKEADLIITIGGVSVGEKDLIPLVMNELGAEEIFGRADIQPGTPTRGYILSGRPVLCLSGNPYAALANFDWYYPYVLSALTGCTDHRRETFKAVLISDYEKINAHTRMVRAYYENGKVSLPAKTHFASSLDGIEECNCYLLAPAGKKMAKGDEAEVYLMKNL